MNPNSNRVQAAMFGLHSFAFSANIFAVLTFYLLDKPMPWLNVILAGATALFAGHHYAKIRN